MTPEPESKQKPRPARRAGREPRIPVPTRYAPRSVEITDLAAEKLGVTRSKFIRDAVAEKCMKVLGVETFRNLMTTKD